MADVSVSGAKNLLNNITNEIKTRMAFDLGDQEMGVDGFMDMMMARVTAAGSDDADLKDIVSKLEQGDASSQAAYLKHLKGLKEKDSADKIEAADRDVVAPSKTEIRAKIKARVKEIVERNQTPVKDDRALQALKKVANFLLKAQQDGQIDLPPEITQKLQDFLAKADDLKAAGLADFMRDFTDIFRNLKITIKPAVKTDATASTDAAVAASADVKAVEPLKWPQDIIDAFKDLHLNGHVASDKPLTLVQVLKALKALVTATENSALKTLHDKDEKPADTVASAEDAKPDANAIAITIAPVVAEILSKDAKAPEDTAKITLAMDGKPEAKAEKEAAAPAASAKVEIPAVAQPDVDIAAAPVVDAAKDVLPKMNLVADKFSDAIKKVDIAARDVKPNAPQPNIVNNAAAARVEVAAAVANAAASDAKPAGAASNSSVNGITNAQAVIAADAPPALQANGTKFASAVVNAAQNLQASKNGAAEQVMVQIQSRMNKSSQISVQLSPAELGRVDVRADIRRDGHAHIVVTADKPETLALLQKDASQLEKALQQAGINTNSENMSFNLREQRQAGQGFGRSKRLIRDAIEEAPVKDLALNVHGDGSIISDTRVDYRA